MITRQSIEGDLLITNEDIGTGCWAPSGTYIPNSIILVINSIEYPVAVPNFFGFGFLHIDVPSNVTLRSGDIVYIKAACSSTSSQPVTTLSINLQISAPNATTCSNTVPVTTTYSDRVRLFIEENASSGVIFNLKLNGANLDKPAFFIQAGSLGNAGSSSGNWTPDPAENTILFSNILYAPTTTLLVTIVNETSYSTIRLGYIEVILNNGQFEIRDYITGDGITVADDPELGGRYNNGDTLSIQSLVGEYSVWKNAEAPFYETDKTVEYTPPIGGGTISPNPTLIGTSSTWTLPPTPGNYPILAKLGDQVQATRVVAVASCQLAADAKTGNATKGVNNITVPTLTGTAPENCILTGFTIRSLPSCGVLRLGVTPVTLNQVIPAADAANLKLDVPANCQGNTLSFNYTAVSTSTGCQESTVAGVVITLAEAIAIANNDSFAGVKGTPIVHNISTNDTLCSAGNTYFEVVSGSVQNGSVSSFEQLTGIATFTPSTPNYIGPAQYSYNLRCGDTFETSVIRSTARVDLMFLGADVVDDEFTTKKNVQFDGNVALNDSNNCGGVVTYRLITGSALHGVVTTFNQATGDFTFVPQSGYSGLDGAFQYELLCDSTVLGSADVRIKIYGAQAVADSLNTNQDTPISGNVSTNDTVVCDQVIEYLPKQGSSAYGTLTSFNKATGAFTFTPAPFYVGIAGFIYEIYCGGEKLAEAQVNINVANTYDYCAGMREIQTLMRNLTYCAQALESVLKDKLC